MLPVIIQWRNHDQSQNLPWQYLVINSFFFYSLYISFSNFRVYSRITEFSQKLPFHFIRILPLFPLNVLNIYIHYTINRRDKKRNEERKYCSPSLYIPKTRNSSNTESRKRVFLTMSVCIRNIANGREESPSSIDKNSLIYITKLNNKSLYHLCNSASYFRMKDRTLFTHLSIKFFFRLGSAPVGSESNEPCSLDFGL